MKTDALPEVKPFVVREESLPSTPRVDPSSPEFTVLMMKALAKAKRIALERKSAVVLPGKEGEATNG